MEGLPAQPDRHARTRRLQLGGVTLAARVAGRRAARGRQPGRAGKEHARDKEGSVSFCRQAQTVSNFYLAFANDLTIVPVLNKMDLPTADPDRVAQQLKNAFEIEPSEVILASAKTGRGIEEILDAAIQRVPPPNAEVYGSR